RFGGAGAEKLFARTAAHGHDQIAIAGVVHRRRFNRVAPQETLTLDGWLGAEKVAHRRLERVDGGDTDLGLSGTFGASDKLMFGDEVGMRVEPFVALRLSTFGFV